MWLAQRGYMRRRGWLAWHVAALSRMDELPPLEALTDPHSAEPTPEEEMNVFLTLKAQLAPIIERAPQ